MPFTLQQLSDLEEIRQLEHRCCRLLARTGPKPEARVDCSPWWQRHDPAK